VRALSLIAQHEAWQSLYTDDDDFRATNVRAGSRKTDSATGSVGV